MIKKGGTKGSDGKVKVNEGGVNTKDGKKKQKQVQTKKTGNTNNERKKLRDHYQLILDTLSVRLPMMVFGEIESLNNFDMEDFVNRIEESSWEVFMPRGVTRDLFKSLLHLYNTDAILASFDDIISRTHNADELPIAQRAQKIAELLATFRFPDKETVLTPWDVVNLHMTNTIGGYDFYDEKHDKQILEPRFVKQDVTDDIFGDKQSHILEINAKSGVYPLWLAYTFYRYRENEYIYLHGTPPKEVEQETIWQTILRDNIFVLCMSPMAVKITERALQGYHNYETHCVYQPKLLEILKNETDKKQLVKDIQTPQYWGIENMEPNKFEFKAVVGNPPYQVMDGGNSASAKPVYHYFASLAKELCPNYFSLIMPARWYAGGKGLDEFRSSMLSDKQIIKLVDFANSADCFPKVNIAGGISYFLWRKNANEDCEIINMSNGKVVSTEKRDLSQYSILVRDNNANSTIQKILGGAKDMMNKRVYSRNSFNLPSNFRGHNTMAEGDYMVLTSNGISYIKPSKIKLSNDLLNSYKVIITYAMSGGNKPSSDGKYQVISSLTVLKPSEICTETFLVLDTFSNELSANSLARYVKTKFFRFLLLQSLTSIHITKDTFRFVPLQDFTSHGDIDWSKSIPEIDQQLYRKYNLSQDEISFIEKMIKPME